MSALRAAIGSVWAINAVAPNASTAAASTVRIISRAPSLAWFARRTARNGWASCKHRIYFDIPDQEQGPGCHTCSRLGERPESDAHLGTPRLLTRLDEALVTGT